MKKTSSFLCKQVAFTLCLSLLGLGSSFAQDREKKPGKGGTDAVPGTVVTAPISLPPPVVGGPGPVTQPPAPPVTELPPVSPTAAPTSIQPLQPGQVGGVSAPGAVTGGKGGKPPKKTKSRKGKTASKVKSGNKTPAKAPVAKGKATSQKNKVAANTPSKKKTPKKTTLKKKTAANAERPQKVKTASQLKTEKGKATAAKSLAKTPVKALTTDTQAPGKGIQASDVAGVSRVPLSNAEDSAEGVQRGEAIDPLETVKTGQVNTSFGASAQKLSIAPKAGEAKTEESKTAETKTAEAKPTETSANAGKGTPEGAVAAIAPIDVSAKANSSGKTSDKCEDAGLKKIYDLMLHDQANTVGIMFELTAMRLAKRALEQMPKTSTFEELTTRNVKQLEKQLASIKTTPEVQKQVKEIYEMYGKKSDLNLISKDFNQMNKRNHDACYFSKNQRFKNEEASTYILAVSLGEKDSELSDIDAATVWVVEKARAEAEKTDPEHYALGRENGNLLNMSTRVSRYLGRIEDGKNATPEVMATLIEAEEKKLVSVLAGVYGQVKVELKACLLEQTRDPKTNLTCKDCAEKQLEAFDQNHGGIDQIQRGLLSTVAKSDNLKMEKDLKGKMGDVVYDFSNFARKGENDVIPPNPPRGKYDACGHALNAVKAAPVKVQTRSPGTSELPMTAPSANSVHPN